jgi:hypothetical protein
MLLLEKYRNLNKFYYKFIGMEEDDIYQLKTYLYFPIPLECAFN